MKQIQELTEYLAKLADGGLCIAFSGGVDSAVILKAACSVSENVHALTMYTPFHSPMEPEEAAKLAADCGAKHHILRMDAIPDEVLQNPPERCYLCKRTIFTRIGDYARENDLRWIVDGTNADDLGEYRPGLKALKELEVKSPLAELGIVKSQVREMAAELGLSIAKKPSAPCLATRFPYNTPINVEQLQKVDALEQLIKGLGPQVVRARIHGEVVRLEVQQEDFPEIIIHREAIIGAVKAAGFGCVALDLEGFRSGSMDQLYLPDRQNT